MNTQTEPRQLTQREYTDMLGGNTPRFIEMAAEVFNHINDADSQITVVKRRANGDPQIFRGQLPPSLERDLRQMEVQGVVYVGGAQDGWMQKRRQQL